MGGFDETSMDKKKAHRDRHSGRKADKKKEKNVHVQELTAKQRNPKAFAINSAVKAERQFRRKQDIDTKKQHIPLVDRTPVEPPPVIVAVVGPPKVGKTLLIQCLIKSFVKQPLTTIKGPVTIVSGKKRRLTILECNNDINSMIDVAKIADLVLLLVDASFGFEMEIFEFLNICQIHGMPRIMGVLTHLDMFKNNKQLKKTKKTLKHRFWTEVYSGAKLFYLSGLIHGEYLRNEIKNLGRFISVMKFRPLTWRTTHPYILVDRMEDLTSPEDIRQNPKVDRNISLYGFVRGIPLNKNTSVHIPGCGDLKIHDVSFLPDPCPLPDKLKKRSLVEKEKHIYAPFSGVGGIVYDKDGVYVELGGSHSYSKNDNSEVEPQQQLVSSLLETQQTLDVKLAHSELQIFSGAAPITSQDVQKNNFVEERVIDVNGRERRKVVFLSEADSDEDENDISEVEKFGAEDENCLSDEMENSDDDEDDKTEISKDFPSNNQEEKQNGEEPYRYVERSTKVDRKIKNKISTILSQLESTGQKPVQFDNSSSDDSDVNETEGEEMDFNDIDSSTVNSKFIFNEDCNNVHNSDLTDKATYYSDTDENYSNEDSTVSSDQEDFNNDENENIASELADESAIQWKSNLAQKAADAILERQANTVNLSKFVYGKMMNQSSQSNDVQDVQELGGLFHIKKNVSREMLDGRDSSVFSVSKLRDWHLPEVRCLIADCFVTGKWKDSEDAAELLKLDDMSDEELYGDFEDLETGEKHTNTNEVMNSGRTEANSKSENEKTSREKLMEKKQKLKEKFDAEYDEKEGGSSYYDDLKKEVERQAQLNKSEFEGLDDDIRVQLEGYRPGMYVRVELGNVPCELVTNFDPSYPLIIGGLQTGEENVGYVQVRVKKHRWHKKILKTRDPIIVSLGWRRFQTLPIYAKLEDNFRHRYLKYTPEHVSCIAHFWGPVTPQGTGFLAVQDVATRQPGFRIAATGVVVELDKSAQIMKKLKLVGTPMKIYKKTAFIQGMFNSRLEVAKFEGARIKTVSGIRGHIKKAASKPEGVFRATFEDKIKLSDIIFCRTWYRVEIPMLYNPVTSLLLPSEQKNAWKGMKTTGQLKREKGIRAEPAVDSLYTPIERQQKVFRPLIIPAKLQKALPYKDKPKLGPLDPKPKLESKRIAVIREPQEQRAVTFVKKLKMSYEKQLEQKKEAKLKQKKERKKLLKKEELKRMQKQKQLRRQVFRALSKMENQKKAHAR